MQVMKQQQQPSLKIVDEATAITKDASAAPNAAAKNLEEMLERVRQLASNSAVLLFSSTDCCMCHVAKQLLFGLGVGPTIIELDQMDQAHDHDINSQAIHSVLSYHLSAAGVGGRQAPAVPAVFVGGEFLGGLEALMSCHISGSLVPLLKEAGALWL